MQSRREGREELASALTHGAGAVASLVGAVVLVVLAGSACHFVAVARQVLPPG